MSQLKSFDVYREIPSDLTEPTVAGATASVTAIILMSLLFVSELSTFLSTETATSMYVDPETDAYETTSRMTINLDIVLPSMPCSLVSVDAQDVMGGHQLDVGGALVKQRLDKAGNPKEANLFMSADLSRDALKKMKGEGCRVNGSMRVKKVPGNFHISAHAHPELIQAYFGDHNPMNCSHIVNHLSFGEPVDIVGQKWAFSPLDNVRKIISKDSIDAEHVHATSFEYYIKVVPTTYSELDGHITKTYQFTASSNALVGHFQVPAIYFRFDLSPITVQFTQKQVSFAHFLVQVCAIIGGVFTMLGLVSQFVHKSLAHVIKKAKEGKLG